MQQIEGIFLGYKVNGKYQKEMPEDMKQRFQKALDDLISEKIYGLSEGSGDSNGNAKSENVSRLIR